MRNLWKSVTHVLWAGIGTPLVMGSISWSTMLLEPLIVVVKEPDVAIALSCYHSNETVSGFWREEPIYFASVTEIVLPLKTRTCTKVQIKLTKQILLQIGRRLLVEGKLQNAMGRWQHIWCLSSRPNMEFKLSGLEHSQTCTVNVECQKTPTFGVRHSEQNATV